jgi:hypothetical protein
MLSMPPHGCGIPNRVRRFRFKNFLLSKRNCKVKQDPFRMPFASESKKIQIYFRFFLCPIFLPQMNVNKKWHILGCILLQ